MSDLEPRDGDLAATASGAGLEGTEGVGASPFDRLPDELIISILEQVFLDSDKNPHRHEPSIELPRVALSKRIYRLARPVWFNSLWREGGAPQEHLFSNLLLHSDVPALVRLTAFSPKRERLGRDCTLLASLTSLSSLDLYFGPDLTPSSADQDDRPIAFIPPEISNLLRSLPNLTTLDLFADWGFFFEDQTFTAADMPRLRSLSIGMTSGSAMRQLFPKCPPSLAALYFSGMGSDEGVFSLVPWTTLRTLKIAISSKARELDGLFEEPVKAAFNSATCTLERFEITDHYNLYGPGCWGDSSPFTASTLSEILTLLGSGGAFRHFVLLWPTNFDWPFAAYRFESITSLTLREAHNLEELSPFRNLCHLILSFPSLSRLTLRNVDFLPDDYELEAKELTAEPSSPLFFVVFPHLAALIALLRRTKVLFLVWESAFAVRYSWNRACAADEFDQPDVGSYRKERDY
ncbi:hypothetical protein JCM6882_008649 [Rhodosporidiobolus microsporus]